MKLFLVELRTQSWEPRRLQLEFYYRLRKRIINEDKSTLNGVLKITRHRDWPPIRKRFLAY